MQFLFKTVMHGNYILIQWSAFISINDGDFSV